MQEQHTSHTCTAVDLKQRQSLILTTVEINQNIRHNAKEEQNQQEEEEQSATAYSAAAAAAAAPAITSTK